MLFDLTDEEVTQLQGIRDELGPQLELREVLRRCIGAMSKAAPNIVAESAARGITARLARERLETRQ